MRDRLTVQDKLLSAAADLDAIVRPFSRGQLVEAAWKQHQATFGMKGADKDGVPFCEKYPDSNAVDTALHGERGLVRRGYLAKLGVGQYQLAAAGLKRVRLLRHSQTERIAERREELLARRA